jgi:hypothetical protein
MSKRDAKEAGDAKSPVVGPGTVVSAERVSPEAKELAKEFNKTPEEVQAEIERLLSIPSTRSGNGRASVPIEPGEELQFHSGKEGAVAKFSGRVAAGRKAPTAPFTVFVAIKGDTVKAVYYDQKQKVHGLSAPKGASLPAASPEEWQKFVAARFVGVKNLPL